MLFGHEFHLVEAGNRYGLPAFYELHTWIWHPNPSGMFEAGTPASTAEGPSTLSERSAMPTALTRSQQAGMRRDPRGSSASLLGSAVASSRASTALGLTGG